MLPQLKQAIEDVVSTYGKEAKKSWDAWAFNKKPADHVHLSLTYLRDHLRGNRKIPEYSLECAGEHEIEFLNNAMNDLKDSLDLSTDQKHWTIDLFNKISVCCLNKYPHTTAEIEIKKALDLKPALKISLDDGKQAILIRMRNMLLSQNI